MTILRSTGPVISTRRHSSAGGIGAIFQSPFAELGRLGQEIRDARRHRGAWRVRRGSATGTGGALRIHGVSFATSASASGPGSVSNPGLMSPVISIPSGGDTDGLLIVVLVGILGVLALGVCYLVKYIHFCLS
jgi:hypothetical protein